MPINIAPPVADRRATERLRSSIALRWTALLVAFCACGLYAYSLMFSRFGFWDDEGYLMATVRAMLQGHLLYDQIYTLYGPFYYAFEGALFSVTGAPVTHDFVRFVGLFFWLWSAGLTAWFVLRLTRSFLLSALTLFLVSKLLVFFSGEPGHPEELCIVCVCLLLALAGVIRGQLNSWTAGLIGFLLAALACTKINIGLYAIFAVLLALLGASPAHRIKRILVVLVLLGSLACTAIIMSPLIGAGWVRNYFLLIVCSIMASFAAVCRARPELAISARSWIILISAFAATGALSVLPFLVHGTTMSALIYISVLQHRNFAREWFVAAPFTAKTTIWAFLSLAVAVFWSSRRVSFSQSRPVEVGLQVAKGLIAVFGAMYAVTVYPDDIYGVHLLKLITPVSWLVMVVPGTARDGRFLFARAFLCFLAVFVALYPFPVASAQLLFALVPMSAVLALFGHDAVVALGGLTTRARWLTVQRFLYSVAVVVVIGIYVWAVHGAYRKYAALVPLSLPGATDIHVAPVYANTYRWVATEVDRRCNSFFSMPGLFSFDFWTGKDTPTMMMMNDWPGFLNTKQQQVVIADLTKNHTSCVIYNPELMDLFRRGKDFSQEPLVRYIRANFQQLEARNGYHLLIRKDR